jgi:hypothetical protein
VAAGGGEKCRRAFCVSREALVEIGLRAMRRRELAEKLADGPRTEKAKVRDQALVARIRDIDRHRKVLDAAGRLRNDLGSARRSGAAKRRSPIEPPFRAAERRFALRGGPLVALGGKTLEMRNDFALEPRAPIIADADGRGKSARLDQACEMDARIANAESGGQFIECYEHNVAPGLTTEVTMRRRQSRLPWI